MIKLSVIGNLGKDAEVKSIGGKNVINFTVAHAERYKDKDGNSQTKTTWVECAKWGESTAVAPYLKKGGQVYVEGTPEATSYTKQDGTVGASLRLRVSVLQLLGGGDSGETTQKDRTPASQKIDRAEELTEPLDDLPF